MASSAMATRRRSGPTLPRYGTPRNPRRQTLGEGVAEVAEALGMPLLPWQRHAVDVALEVDAKTGQLWYRQVNIACSRQCGKTSLMLALLTHRCTRFGGPQNVVFLAQTRDEARKKFVEEHEPALRSSQTFGKHYDLRLSNGSEHLRWANRSRWGILAPTRKAGHGITIDLAALDEAFSYADDRVEQALRPAMITRPSRQTWVISTAGDAESHYWWRKVEAGRRACETGQHGRTAYLEWSAPGDADPGDEEVWWQTIPALGHTIPVDAIREEWAQAQREGDAAVRLFRRAYLNQWPEIPQQALGREAWQVIAEAEWRAAADPDSVIAERAPVVFGVDVTPDRAWSTIAVAGPTADGLAHVELVDHAAGTGWLLDRVRDLDERWQPMAWALDPAGPMGAYIDDLRPLLGDRLRATTARDIVQAATGFAEDVRNRRIVHRGEVELDDAVSCARRREVGDSWAWARGGPHPISPLVAVTFARWAMRRSAGDKPKTGPVFAY